MSSGHAKDKPKLQPSAIGFEDVAVQKNIAKQYSSFVSISPETGGYR
jgi:hypothetical protein